MHKKECVIHFCPMINNKLTLKGTTGQIRSAREWSQWIGLSKDMPRYRFLIFKF
jgi:hypothetical protein